MKRLTQALLALLGLALSGMLLALRGEPRRAVGVEGDPSAQSPGHSLKRRLMHGALLLLALGIGAFLLVAAGVVPIKASSGHWAITRWFLDFAKVRSVSTHSIVLEAPPLDDPALVLKGAGHFDFGCRPCHGGVEQPQPKIPSAMTPHPPFLPTSVPRWEAEELFYIVKHGIKFTGMPAWPSRKRDDEVWAVAAFLLKMPELSDEEFQQLVSGDVTADDELAPVAGLPESGSVATVIRQSCARCHGLQGKGRGADAFPVLAGQTEEYLAASLQSYARGERHSGIMQPLAVGLDDDQLRQLAAYYSRLDGLSSPGTEDSPGTEKTSAEAAEVIELGRRVALEGIAEQNLPACADCHGPANQSLNENFPRLAGQYAGYLELQLELFKKRSRGGTEFAHLMHEVADHINPDQMRAVARYYERLGRPEETAAGR